MSSRRSLLLLIALTLGVLVTLLLLSKGEGGADVGEAPLEPTAAAGAASPAAPRSTAEPAADLAGAASPGSRANAAGPVTIRVVDEAQRPVAGASVELAAPDLRVLFRAWAPEVLVRSDDGGVAEIPYAAFQSVARRGDTLAVGKRGFVHVLVPVAELRSGGEATVVLRATCTQRVRCVDPDDNPVPDAVVAVSRLPFEEDTLLALQDQHGTPGSSPRTAIHLATSGSDGVALLTDLEAGEAQHLRAVVPSMAMADLELGGASELVLPRDELTIRFAPMFAAVVRIEGDDVMAHSAYPADPGFQRVGWCQAATDSARRGLEHRFPGAIVSVWARVASEAPPGDPELRLRAFLARRDEVAVRVPLLPLDAIEGPVVIDAETLGPDVAATVAGTLAFVDPDGASLPIDAFCVRIPAILDSGIPVPVSPGDLRLPEGSYSLWAPSPWLLDGLEDRTIQVPGANVVHLKQRFRRCRFQVDLGRSNLVTPLGIRVLVGKQDQLLVRSWASTEPEAWLPVGPVHVELLLDREVLDAEDLTVEPDPAATTQEIHLRSPLR